MADYSYIQLTRRFLDIGTSEPDDDPQAAMLLAAGGKNQGVTWKEVLGLDAAIILGSAGSGKTTEVLNQARRLRDSGTAAFVLRLEALCRQSLQHSFSPDDRGGDASFASWRRTGSEAVAFLDALDEARLPQAHDTSALADALSQLSAGVGRHGKTLRLVITTRGSEWRGSSDLALVTSALRRLRQVSPESEDGEGQQLNVSVFRLAQLDARDICEIARSRSVDPEVFIGTVNASLSADLMRQPLEVHFLLDLWLEQIANGRPAAEAFSSRRQVFDSIVSARLRTGPGQVRRSNIDPISARHACEKLAAAVVVTGVRDLSTAGEASLTISALDILATDTDRWSEVETRQLLSSAVFHPSVGGRIRVAHREIQDFLAANFFKRAIARSAGSLDVVSPLVARGLGDPQVPQSTEQVLGWLATLSQLARPFVTQLKPALLIETGDPRSLSANEREKALRAQVALYEDRKFRGEFFHRDDTVKFSTPDLAPAVRELLSQTTSPEVRGFLVEVARFGQMTELGGELCALITDDTQPTRVRTECCFALDTFNDRTYSHAVLRAALLSPQADLEDTDQAPSWNMFQIAALTYAYPSAATILDMITIVARLTREARNYSSMTSDLLVGLATKLDEQGRRDWLQVFLRFACHGRDPDRYQMPTVVPRYTLLAPAIARMALDLLRQDAEQGDQDFLLDALEYLFQIQEGHSFSKYRTTFEELAIELHSQGKLKEALVSRRTALFDETAPGNRIAFNALYPIGLERDQRIPPIFTDEDVRAFCRKMRDASSPRERTLAFECAQAIMGKLVDDSQRQRAFAEISSAARRYGDAETRRRSGSINWRLRRFFVRFRHDYQYRIRRWLRSLPEWSSDIFWRSRNTLAFIRRHRAIQDASDTDPLVWATRLSLNRIGSGTIEEVRKRHGKWIAGWFNSGLRCYWRRYPISYADRNTYGALVGLAGLALEADNGLLDIHREDAVKAFEYAFCDLNNFPDWLPALATTHLATFIDVCAPLVREDLRNSNPESQSPSDVVSKLAYSNVAIRAAVAPLFLVELQGVLQANPADLEIAAHIVARSTSVDRSHARDLLQARFRDAVVSFDFRLAWIWLEALFEADASAACDAICTCFGDEWDASAASVFLGFLGRNRRRFSRVEEFAEERDDLVESCFILGRMVRVSYLVWPPEKDMRHEEVYSPTLKDRAADRRRFYLEELVRHNSQPALDALDGLIRDPRLIKFRDTFLYQRDQVVRNSARRPAYTVEEAIGFLNGVSKRPTTVTEFRELVRRHLDGLLYRLRNSDDDESYVFRRGGATEDDLRNWLSARLREVGDDYYTVIREQEVAVENRPDLRIHSRSHDLGFVSVEIKMADEDHWSGDVLIEKIQTQLAEQYLLEEGSHTGFYLLANGARPRRKEVDRTGATRRKAFRKKIAGQWVDFAGLIEAATTRAAEVTESLPGDKVVQIVNIDLSEK